MELLSNSTFFKLDLLIDHLGFAVCLNWSSIGIGSSGSSDLGDSPTEDSHFEKFGLDNVKEVYSRKRTAATPNEIRGRMFLMR